MGTGRTDEFRKDAVRIALTSRLSRRQVADALEAGQDPARQQSGLRRAALRRRVGVRRLTDREHPRESRQPPVELHLHPLAFVLQVPGHLLVTSERRCHEVPIDQFRQPQVAHHLHLLAFVLRCHFWSAQNGVATKCRSIG